MEKFPFIAESRMRQRVILGIVAVSSFVSGMWFNGLRQSQEVAATESTLEGESQRQSRRVRERSGGGGSDSEEMFLSSVLSGGRVDHDKIAKLLENQVPMERLETVERLASEWGRRNPHEALEWASELQGRERRVAFESIFGRWSEQDPEMAASAAMELPQSSMKLDLVHWMTESWARRDLARATDWVKMQGEEGSGGRAILGLMEAMADQSHEDAADFAMNLERRDLRMEALRISARRWAEHDPGESLDWAQQLEGQARVEVADEIFHQVAEYDPSLAAEFYEAFRNKLVGEEELPGHLAAGIASRMMEFDPAGAADWTLSLPGRLEEKSQVVAEVTERWLGIDDEDAVIWVSGLEPGRPRDMASDRIAHHLIEQDPGVALVWADQIGDRGHRGDLMIHVLEAWHDQDAFAARTAYQEVNLEEEHRRVIEEEIFQMVDPAPFDDPAGE